MNIGTFFFLMSCHSHLLKLLNKPNFFRKVAVAVVLLLESELILILSLFPPFVLYNLGAAEKIDTA